MYACMNSSAATSLCSPPQHPAGAAQNVYDTAAGAVGAAAQGGRQTLEAGRAAGRTAADRTTVALDTTAVRARQGADDLQRGYDLVRTQGNRVAADVLCSSNTANTVPRNIHVFNNPPECLMPSTRASPSPLSCPRHALPRACLPTEL